MRRTLAPLLLIAALCGLQAPAHADTPFRHEIDAAAQRHGVPVELIEAIIRVESSGNPLAVSRAGARGLMQLMPGTAALLGVRDSFDPRQNIDGGVRHLTALIERFDRLPLVLAAYHAGAGAVTTYGGIPPFPETRSYVTKVLDVFEDLSRRAEATRWAAAPARAERTARHDRPAPHDVFTSADPKMPPLTREELDAIIRAATRETD